MFKKIHSNRDPGHTVYSEVKKEFAVYFDKTRARGEALIERYPKLLYGFMVFLLFVSMVLSFTVFRNREPAKKNNAALAKPLSPVSDGFSRILETGAALKETIGLKKVVDSLSAKKLLTKQDSAVLLNALGRLKQINNQLTH